MEIACNICKKDMAKPGAVLYGPPNKDDKCKKFHICTDCYTEDPKEMREKAAPGFNEAQKIVGELIASSTLCDHMGDMWSSLDHAADKVGLPKLTAGDEDGIIKWAVKNGFKTVNGTSLDDDEEDES